ncbi:MAG: hypothetical protein RMJ97_06650 [Raineya sp.]|nr:hypothetical protein [Raineya sp.]MDW8296549.1 hypothetical protein [Raineya sp.]
MLRVVCIAVWTLSLFFSLSNAQNIKLKKINLTPGIRMLMPSDFTPIPDEVLVKKYFTTKKPTAMYSDPTGEIDLGVNITNNFWQEQDIPMLKDLYKGSLRASYTRVQFLTEDVRIINKRQFVVLEFIGIVEDDKEGVMGRKNALSRYNYMMYTVVQNRIVVVNFNCPTKHQATWQPIVPKIMQSVKISNLKENEPKKPTEGK